MAKHEVPLRALKITSKAGFITKELWRDFVYGSVGQSVAEKRKYHWAWSNLLEKGYLIPHPNKHLSNVLVFNKNSREAMRTTNGVVSRSPYESNLRHDEILLHGILKIENAEIVHHWTLEAELKANERDEFRLTSQGKSIKYPDVILYMHPKESNTKVAVELELTLKNRSRYKQIIGAYGFLDELSKIVFVSATPAIERAIKETIANDHMAANSNRFGFMALSDWQSNPVNAGIELEDENKSLKNLF